MGSDQDHIYARFIDRGSLRDGRICVYCVSIVPDSLDLDGRDARFMGEPAGLQPSE